MAKRCGKFHGNGMIRWSVGNLHVSLTPDEAVEAEKAKFKKGFWETMSPASQRSFECEVKRVHAENQKLYREVMGGGFGDWEPPPEEQRHWHRFLYWLNRDMHLRGLVGVRPFPDAATALNFTAELIMKSGLAVRPIIAVNPNTIQRRRGQFVFDLGMDTGKGEPVMIKGHKLIFAWDVIDPKTRAAVAYAQITT